MKSGKVLVSVVMSVYNDEQYLKESLDSIFAQTIQYFELIIVDDCSTDRTVEIIENYHDDRIRLIRNTENRGLTRNLNTALEYVQGTYIARMDGDDKSRPERFEKQIAYLEPVSYTHLRADADQLQDAYVWRRRADLADSGNTETAAGDDADPACIGTSWFYDARGADYTGRFPV